MSKELRLLYVEDDQENRDGLIEILSDDNIGGYTIKIEAIDSFEGAFEKTLEKHYHIIILDLFKGKPDSGGEEIGLEILKKIQDTYFVPVIFYSGNTTHVQELKSQIIGIATKGDGGVTELKEEIERLIKFNLPFVKENIHNYLEQELKSFFWDIIHKEKEKFAFDNNDFSLGYLMLRKFGNSLSKEKISKILGDEELKKDKVHPMSFYIYPTDKDNEYENGEILKKGEDIFVMLTPSCDFVDRGAGKRTTGRVLLTKTILLSEREEYSKFSANKNVDNTNNLKKLIESRKGDRYFFLPQTPFIENRIIDFQVKEMVDYESLGGFVRLAKLDNPFAEGMTASFIRYYNRIGYPDLDSDLIIKDIK